MSINERILGYKKVAKNFGHINRAISTKMFKLVAFTALLAVVAGKLEYKYDI